MMKTSDTSVLFATCSPYILVILGKSRSGKDTAFRLLKEAQPALVNIKFSSPMKRMFEYAYGLPEGGLEDPVIRSKEVPELPGVTYLDIMIRAWQYFPQIDPLMMVRKVKQEASQLLAQGAPIAFTDVRNQSEVDVLSELSQTYPLHLIRLHRADATGVLSDGNVDDYENKLAIKAATYRSIQNDYATAHLSANLKELVNELIAYP